MRSVLQDANAAGDREERIKAVDELRSLVHDWKGNELGAFGELRLFGAFIISRRPQRDREVNHPILLHFRQPSLGISECLGLNCWRVLT